MTKENSADSEGSKREPGTSDPTDDPTPLGGRKEKDVSTPENRAKEQFPTYGELLPACAAIVEGRHLNPTTTVEEIEFVLGIFTREIDCRKLFKRTKFWAERMRIFTGYLNNTDQNLNRLEAEGVYLLQDASIKEYRKSYMAMNPEKAVGAIQAELELRALNNNPQFPLEGYTLTGDDIDRLFE